MGIEAKERVSREYEMSPLLERSGSWDVLDEVGDELGKEVADK